MVHIYGGTVTIFLSLGREDFQKLAMKIMHWNVCKRSHPLFGAKRYEDELFDNIRALLIEDLEIERVQRQDNEVIGSVPLSWLFRYRRKGADIVHATYQTIAPAAYFRRPRRFIVTVLDLSPMLYPSEYSQDKSSRIQWLLSCGALKRVDRIIAISDFTKKEVIRIAGVDESMIDVVHLGVDHSRYYPVSKNQCKRRFGFDTEEKHILVVASNLAKKRMDLTQSVFDEVRKQRRGIKLIKAGYAETLGGNDIVNIGWVPEAEMPLLYNSADVFLHTSEYEGFGLPILEAMSCGVPVVVSNRASIPEVVGSYGNMVDLDADDVIEQFVNKILSCIDKGIDEEAIERSENFSWKKTAEETVRIYKELYNQ